MWRVIEQRIGPIVTRKEAREKGLKRYFTGKTCVYGHKAERLVSSARCAECHKNKNRMKDKLNPERGRKKARAWRLNNLEAAKTKALARVLKWQKENPDKARRRNLRWKAAHPLSCRAVSSRRRGRLRGAEGAHSKDDIAALYKRQKHKCANSRCTADLVLGYHIDHIIPLSRSGSNWPSNLQLLCPPCNSSKGVRTNQEWLGE